MSGIVQLPKGIHEVRDRSWYTKLYFYIFQGLDVNFVGCLDRYLIIPTSVFTHLQ